MPSPTPNPQAIEAAWNELNLVGASLPQVEAALIAAAPFMCSQAIEEREAAITQRNAAQVRYGGKFSGEHSKAEIAVEVLKEILVDVLTKQGAEKPEIGDDAVERLFMLRAYDDLSDVQQAALKSSIKDELRNAAPAAWKAEMKRLVNAANERRGEAKQSQQKLAEVQAVVEGELQKAEAAAESFEQTGDVDAMGLMVDFSGALRDILESITGEKEEADD